MEYGVKTHRSGPNCNFPIYEESLLQVRSGSRTTVVATILMRDDEHGHLCQTELKQQKFKYKGTIDKDTIAITLLNARVTHLGHPVLEIDEHSETLQHKMRTARDFLKVAETCSGIGGLGTGAAYAGWEVTVQNDIQKRFTDHQKQYTNHQVVNGSICDLRTVAAMHHADSQSACMAWGYACQPFSSLGDRNGGNDQRAATLTFGLYASFLLRKEVLVLECVANAASNAFVQQAMHYHTSQTRSTKSEIILELNDIWVSKRRRYWTVVVKDHMGKVTLRPLPKLMQTPNINALFPGFLQLSGSELAQLSLTKAEWEAFLNYGRGLEAQMVNPQCPAETALQSWGNQVHACACECRQGFSQSRLQSQGLFGALVRNHVEGEGDVIRHLGPREMALLNGLVKHEGWADKPTIVDGWHWSTGITYSSGMDIHFPTKSFG